jgi:hypothetical protein
MFTQGGDVGMEENVKILNLIVEYIRRCGEMMSVTREIKRFVRDALESRGVIQGVRTVEVGLEELEKYLEYASLDVGDLLEALMDMRKFGDLV